MPLLKQASTLKCCHSKYATTPISCSYSRTATRHDPKTAASACFYGKINSILHSLSAAHHRGKWNWLLLCRCTSGRGSGTSDRRYTELTCTTDSGYSASICPCNIC